MIIDNKNINIDDLFDEKYMHKKIKKNIFLSNHQCQILLNYKINPYECASINDLLFRIEEVLKEDSDAEDLELISKEIEEFNYYTNTNK